jgi:hypothetical protein
VVQVFILASFICSMKNEDLIPESFMKISSSSLDFHKNGVPGYAFPDLRGSLKSKNDKADFKINRLYLRQSPIIPAVPRIAGKSIQARTSETA